MSEMEERGFKKVSIYDVKLLDANCGNIADAVKAGICGAHHCMRNEFRARLPYYCGAALGAGIALSAIAGLYQGYKESKAQKKAESEKNKTVVE